MNIEKVETHVSKYVAFVITIDCSNILMYTTRVMNIASESGMIHIECIPWGTVHLWQTALCCFPTIFKYCVGITERCFVEQ